jgi:hypothetical protein
MSIRPVPPVVAVTGVVVLLGTAARVAFAMTRPAILWPDEIYQMSEAAHRVVFGYGIVPWEFEQGLRSWLGPGLLLPPTLLQRALELDGAGGMVLVKVWVALWAGTAALSAAVYATYRAGPGAGLLAAVLVAFSPIGLVYDAHSLSDVVATPVLVGALALLTRRGRACPALGGALLVVAVVLRPQLVVLAAGIVVLPLLDARRWSWLPPLGGALAAATGAAVLDRLTWGIPFSPAWRSLTVNVVEDRARRYGVSPVDMYVTTLPRAMGWALAVLLLAGLVAAVVTARTEWPLALALVSYVGVLSLIAHKELRFVLPALPLLSAVAAVGLARAVHAGARRLAGWRGVPARRLALGALAVAAALAGLLRTPGVTLDDLGYADITTVTGTPWTLDGETPRALSAAGVLPEVCGVVLLTQTRAYSGGYSYLHRDVLLWSLSTVRTVPQVWVDAADVLVSAAPERVPAQYRPVLRVGRTVVYERPGGCAAPPSRYSRTI